MIQECQVAESTLAPTGQVFTVAGKRSLSCLTARRGVRSKKLRFGFVPLSRVLRGLLPNTMEKNQRERLTLSPNTVMFQGDMIKVPELNDLNDLIECRNMLIKIIAEAEKLVTTNTAELQTVQIGLKFIEEKIESLILNNQS